MRHARLQQLGLTITESITALLVLGIGVLSIATVYLERTQAAPAVLLHSKAGRLAAEMAERIRSARGQPVHFENPIGVVCRHGLSDATRQEQAANDIACWQDEVARILPNGSAAIMHDTDRLDAAYLITVSWSAPGSGTASYILRVAADDSARH